MAAFVAKNMDVAALGAHVEKFLEPSFLPSYLQSDTDFPLLKGIPYGPLSMVDTQQYAVTCSSGIGECRALSDYVLNLILYSCGDSLTPRCLILVSGVQQSSRDQRMIKIPEEFDIGAAVSANLPRMFREVTERAIKAETEYARLETRLSNLDRETSTLREEHKELVSFRENPLNVVLRRLDELSSKVDSLTGVQRQPAANYASPPLMMAKRSPVSSTLHPTSEPEYEVDWMKTIALILLAFLVPVLAYVIYGEIRG